jgi:mRNA interferase HigB
MFSLLRTLPRQLGSAMHVITRKKLRDFCIKYPDAEEPLEAWYRLTKKAKWKNLAETRKDFPHADLVGECTVFNIGGNKYRLITAIHYNRQRVFIIHVLTHKEYDKGKWKDDCGC